MKLSLLGQGFFRYGLLAISSAAGMLAPLHADVMLQWGDNTEQELAGYQVFFGTEPGVYTQNIDAGAESSILLSNLAPNTTYYAVVSAYNTHREESPFSNEISFTTGAITQETPGIRVVNFTAPTLIDGEPHVQFTLQGEINSRVEVLASSNLKDWEVIGSQVNTNGTIVMPDPEFTGESRRYYRLSITR